jgi:hypothetical protein
MILMVISGCMEVLIYRYLLVHANNSMAALMHLVFICRDRATRNFG